MANKRQRKKQQKKQQQQKLIQSGFQQKEVRKLSQPELSKQYKTIITAETRKEKQREYSRKRRQKLASQRQEKLFELEKLLGTNALDFGKKPTAKFLDSLLLDDLKKGKYKRTDFKDYTPKKKPSIIDTIDFNKLHQIPNGKKLHFAFRALNGEKDIGDELDRFSKFRNEELLSFLQSIKDMPLTGSRNVSGKKGRNVGSSGQAGEGNVELISQNSLTELIGKTRYNENRRAKTRYKKLAKSAQKKGINFQHSDIDYKWQYISQKTENGRSTGYTEISIRKLLIIGNAILWNIREDDREGFYNDYYSKCVQIIPEMKKILP